MDTSADRVLESSVDTSADRVLESSVDTSADETRDKSIESPADGSVEKSLDKSSSTKHDGKSCIWLLTAMIKLIGDLNKLLKNYYFFGERNSKFCR